MELQKDAVIVTHDGQEVGHLDRVAINPRSKEVTHLVVRKGKLFPTDKVVEMTYVDEVTADRITLRPEAGDPQYLPPFQVKYYVNANAPHAPKDSLGGLGRTFAPKGYWTAPAGDIGGLGGVPLRGLPDSALPLPNLPSAGEEVEVERNIPETTVALKEGAKVIAEDGAEVGRLVRILTAGTDDRATHFVIAHGALSQDHKAVPMDWVGEVLEKEVRLLVAGDAVEQLGPYEATQQ